MVKIEVLVIKGGSINWLATSAVTRSYVTSLNYKSRDNSVEFWAFVVKRLAWVSNSGAALTKCGKVLCGLGGNVTEETKDNSTNRFTLNFNVEVYFIGYLWLMVLSNIEIGLSNTEHADSGGKNKCDHKQIVKK